MGVIILKRVGVGMNITLQHVKGFVWMRWCGGFEIIFTHSQGLMLDLSNGQQLALHFEHMKINLRSRDVSFGQLVGRLGQTRLEIEHFYANFNHFVFSTSNVWLGSSGLTVVSSDMFYLAYNASWEKLLLTGSVSISSVLPLYNLRPLVQTVRTRLATLIIVYIYR